MGAYKFKSEKVKKLTDNQLSSSLPDYSNIIKLNKTYFTLTGWMDFRGNIDYTLEEITKERLSKDKYLAKEFIEVHGKI